MKLKRAQKPEPEAQLVSSGAWPHSQFGGLDAFQQWWASQLTSMWTGVPWMDEEAALGVPAVSASLGLLAAYVTQMPLEAVNDYSTPPAVVTPSPTIVRAPLGDARVTNNSFQDWIEPLLRDLALWGNHLAVLGNVDWTGWPTQLFPVAVGMWSVEVRNGVRVYHIGASEYDPAEVLHVKINARNGELVGRGLMNTNRDTLAAAIAAERWAARYFETGTAPSVHIQHPNADLTQGQADELKQKFLDATAGSRQPVVTPVGTSIDVLPNDAESAQLVEARKWANQALAMALGVQPAMLGLEGPSMTYRNINEVNQQTINTTVMRYLVPVEQALTAQCLPRGTRARFATSALVRPDLGERITQATTALAAGLITVDEARAWIDLQPNESLNQPQGAPVATDVPAPPPVPVASDVPALAVVGGQ